MQKAIPNNPSPYPKLNGVLRELIGRTQAVLGKDFLAAYLQGSFAVGDFDPHSDVDFVVVVEDELAGDQVEALQAVHARIFDQECAWAQHLEGSYFPREILKDYRLRGSPLWYLDHGSRSLTRHAHDNTILVRWVLRERGVVLAGPDPAALVGPIPVAALRREILETINGWGQQILADPRQIDSRFYQTFAVLNYCRMLHDLYRGHPGSKRAGAEWAKVVLDPSWAGLIDRAWDGRPDPAHSSRQPADPLDLRRTLEFIQHIMEKGKQIAAALERGEELPDE